MPANLRAAAAALAAGLIFVPAAHASNFGPAMSAAQVRSMQAQGVREIVLDRRPGVSADQLDAPPSAGRRDLSGAGTGSRAPS